MTKGLSPFLYVGERKWLILFSRWVVIRLERSRTAVVGEWVNRRAATRGPSVWWGYFHALFSLSPWSWLFSLSSPLRSVAKRENRNKWSGSHVHLTLCPVIRWPQQYPHSYCYSFTLLPLVTIESVEHIDQLSPVHSLLRHRLSLSLPLLLPSPLPVAGTPTLNKDHKRHHQLSHQPATTHHQQPATSSTYTIDYPNKH